MTIGQRQNTEPRLQELAAQRQVYRDAKTIFLIQTIVAVPCVALGSLAVAIFHEFKPYLVLWSIIVTMADLLIFSRYLKRLRSLGARVQEQFDCDVLALEWNDVEIGARSDPEEIRRYLRRYQRRTDYPDGLVDWYPSEFDKLPIEAGRIACQRMNAQWEAELRRKYSNWLVSLLSIVGACIVIAGLVGDLKVGTIATSILVPLTPVFMLGLRQYHEHREAQERAAKIKKLVDSAWLNQVRRDTSSSNASALARKIQNLIFDHRRASPLVLDRFYSWLQRSQQDEMTYAAGAMVTDYYSHAPLLPTTQVTSESHHDDRDDRAAARAASIAGTEALVQRAQGPLDGAARAAARAAGPGSTEACAAGGDKPRPDPLSSESHFEIG